MTTPHQKRPYTCSLHPPTNQPTNQPTIPPHAGAAPLPLPLPRLPKRSAAAMSSLLMPDSAAEWPASESIKHRCVCVCVCVCLRGSVKLIGRKLSSTHRLERTLHDHQIGLRPRAPQVEGGAGRADRVVAVFCVLCCFCSAMVLRSRCGYVCWGFSFVGLFDGVTHI